MSFNKRRISLGNGSSAARVGRRNLLRSSLWFAVCRAFLAPDSALAMTNVINVCAPPYEANPKNADNSSAFQAAFDQIAKTGGGTLYIPGGTYNLASPIIYNGQTVTIRGDGPQNSVLSFSHSGVGLTLNLSNVFCTASVSSLGFTPCPGASTLCQGGLAIVLPQGQAGWQNAFLEDVTFGALSPAVSGRATAFLSALSLTNTWRASISRCNFVAGSLYGGNAIYMLGFCIDTRVTENTFENYNIGIYYRDYSEGLHFAHNDFVGGIAILTSTVQNSHNLSFLEIFIESCNIVASQSCFDLCQVKNVYMSGSSLASGQAPPSQVALCVLQGCQVVHITGCLFDAGWSTTSQTSAIGVLLNPSATVPTTTSIISDCDFIATCVAIEFGPGAAVNNANSIGLFQVGQTQLVDGAYGYSNGAKQQVFIDNSGTNSNNVMWRRSAGNLSLSANRLGSEN